jgi:hypothetical protein
LAYVLSEPEGSRVIVAPEKLNQPDVLASNPLKYGPGGASAAAQGNCEDRHREDGDCPLAQGRRPKGFLHGDISLVGDRWIARDGWLASYVAVPSVALVVVS